MSSDLVNSYVWYNAGFSFTEDGVYVIDYGFEWKVGTWDEIGHKEYEY